MLYRTADDMMIEAGDAEEIVTVLRRSSWEKYEDNFTYMEHAARKAFETTGEPIRWGSASDFVTDLMKVGLLTEEKAPTP